MKPLVLSVAGKPRPSATPLLKVRSGSGESALIVFLMVLCWVWWDKMRQIKWVAAECLADAINAKRIAEDRALEAIGLYNRHIEQCNRVIESQESGLPGASPTISSAGM